MEYFISIVRSRFNFLLKERWLYLLSRKIGRISLVKGKLRYLKYYLSTDNSWLVEKAYRDLNGCNIDSRIFKKLTEL